MGYFCPSTTTATQCDATYYCAAGSTGQTKCLQDYACSTPSVQAPCASTYYCPTGTVTAVKCAAGSMCPDAHTQTALEPSSGGRASIPGAGAGPPAG